MDDTKKDEQNNIDDLNLNENQTEDSGEAEILQEEQKVQEPDYKDKYTRLLAEFSNYQRQKEIELRSMASFGNSNLLSKIIDIMDDLEMGLMQENLTEDTKNILNLLKEKLTHLLTIENVKEIQITEGDDFDSMKCEAIHAIEDEKNKGKVIQIARKGYMISDRVLRTAKVIVGKQ